jgi:hypothetical protein
MAAQRGQRNRSVSRQPEINLKTAKALGLAIPQPLIHTG